MVGDFERGNKTQLAVPENFLWQLRDAVCPSFEHQDQLLRCLRLRT